MGIGHKKSSPGTRAASPGCSCGWEAQLTESRGEGVEEQNLFLLPGSGTASPKCLVRDLEGQTEGLQLNAYKLCQEQRLLGVKACKT